MDSLARAAIAAEKNVNVASLPASTIAVPPLAMITSDSTMAALGYGLADLLSTDLATTPRLTVVDRLRLEAVLRELRLAQTGLVDSQTAPRMGRILGARQLVVGSLSTFPDSQIQITLQLADVATGRVTPVQSGRTPLNSVVDAEVQLAYSIYGALGIVLTPAERAAIAANATRNFAALMAYSRGVRDEAYGEYATAATEYKSAVQADPKFSAAQTRLSVSQSVQVSNSQEAPPPKSGGNGPSSPGAGSSSITNAINNASSAINPSGVDITTPGNNANNPSSSNAQNASTQQAAPVTQHNPIIATLVITIHQLP